MVEVGLGPDGAFENGNLGRLTRQVPASQVVCAIPPRRGRAKRPKPPKKPRPSSAAKFLRLAREWQRQLDAGEIESQAAIARREGLTRARVCQIVSLLQLAPTIRARILSEGKSSPLRITERVLRAVARLTSAERQVVTFRHLENAILAR